MDCDEYPSFYIWPANHEDGEEFPEDFYAKVRRALATEGLESETC